MGIFSGRHFPRDIILWAVRWYCRYGVSYRDLEVKSWGAKFKNNPSVFMNLLHGSDSYTDWEAGRDWLNTADWDVIPIR